MYPVGRWIKKLQANGLTYEISVLERLGDNATNEELNDAEIFHIAYYRSIGMKLLNITDGGDGQSLGYKPSEETRKKVSVACKGKLHSKEARMQMSVSQKKRWETLVLSAETRGRMSDSHKGKKQSPELVEKRAAANRGKKRSQEAKEATAAKLRGRKRTPEQIEKTIAPQRGRKLKPEHVAKVAAALTGRKHTPEHCANAAEGLKKYANSPEGRARLLAQLERARAIYRNSKASPKTGVDDE